MSVYGDEIGIMAKYTCHVGFEFSGGSRVRQCLNNGTWSGPKPLCREVGKQSS